MAGDQPTTPQCLFALPTSQAGRQRYFITAKSHLPRQIGEVFAGGGCHFFQGHDRDGNRIYCVIVEKAPLFEIIGPDAAHDLASYLGAVQMYLPADYSFSSSFLEVLESQRRFYFISQAPSKPLPKSFPAWGYFSESNALRLFIQITSCLLRLHSHGMAHLTICPDAVSVEPNGPPTARLGLSTLAPIMPFHAVIHSAAFGIKNFARTQGIPPEEIAEMPAYQRIIYRAQHHTANLRQQPYNTAITASVNALVEQQLCMFDDPSEMIHFLPPEVFVDYYADPQLVDSWSLGALLAYMVTGKGPIASHDLRSHLSHSSHRHFTPELNHFLLVCHPNTASLLLGLLNPDPQRRARIQDLPNFLFWGLAETALCLAHDDSELMDEESEETVLVDGELVSIGALFSTAPSQSSSDLSDDLQSNTPEDEELQTIITQSNTLTPVPPLPLDRINRVAQNFAYACISDVRPDHHRSRSTRDGWRSVSASSEARRHYSQAAQVAARVGRNLGGNQNPLQAHTTKRSWRDVVHVFNAENAARTMFSSRPESPIDVMTPPLSARGSQCVDPSSSGSPASGAPPYTGETQLFDIKSRELPPEPPELAQVLVTASNAPEPRLSLSSDSDTESDSELKDII